MAVFRIRHCHYCGQPLPEVRMGARLTLMKARVFDLVQRAGPDGIDGRDLFDITYAGQEAPGRDALKSHVKQINELIEGSGYMIRGYGTYRLVRIREAPVERKKERRAAAAKQRGEGGRFG